MIATSGVPFHCAVFLQQHPCGAFTEFLIRETTKFGFNNMHFITEYVQIHVMSVKLNNIWFVLKYSLFV